MSQFLICLAVALAIVGCIMCGAPAGRAAYRIQITTTEGAPIAVLHVYGRLEQITVDPGTAVRVGVWKDE